MIEEQLEQTNHLLSEILDALTAGKTTAAPAPQKEEEELTKQQKAARTRAANKAAKEAAADKGKAATANEIQITEVRDVLSALDRQVAKDILDRCGVKSLKDMAASKKAQELYAKALTLAEDATMEGSGEEDMLA